MAIPLKKGREFIEIRGARVHNLKNIDVKIPRNKLVVVTGVSGSGKSSLAFDTLYAEGQRRYVESLSSYARQFLGKLDKPDVDQIIGISPAIAIEQKVISRNSRSTVGTSTEIYDYLKLLYARIGKTYSPISGAVVKRHHVTDVVNYITALPSGSRVAIYAPVIASKDRSIGQQLALFIQQGYVRVKIDDEIANLEEIQEQSIDKKAVVRLIIDRISVGDDHETARIADSVQAAFFEGHGECEIEVFDPSQSNTLVSFSNRFELDGMTFEEPNEHFFSFNNPVGACKTCEGYGSVIGIDPDAVIPNKELSVYEDAIVCWKGDKMSEWKHQFVKSAHKFDFPVHRSISELSPEEYEILWTGNKYVDGLNQFFTFLEENTYKIQYRVMLSRYRGKTTCPDCKGTRLRKDADYVKINGKSILDIVRMSIDEAHRFFNGIELSDYEEKVAGRLLIEIKNRLAFLLDVGLSYLTLNRLSNTLSGGESQRINLATSLGSSLVGSMYILDEPSIGLHSRDTERLIRVLQGLKKVGNTVIVVEHDEDVMRAADEIIDMGPQAGSQGGTVIFQGDHSALIQGKKSLTAQYLTGDRKIEVPTSRRPWRRAIKIDKAAENNLNELSVEIPLDVLTVITGVSGSGKSTLIKKILLPAITRRLGGQSDEMTGKVGGISGDLDHVGQIEYIDQNPIGKSSRSNPATYMKAFDEIRNLMAAQPAAKALLCKPSTFSFNVAGGRCDECEGEGQIKVEMQFIADVYLTCESCQGKRFKDDVLSIKYRGKNIYDILELTVDDAIEFFGADQKNKICEKLIKRLLPLQQVGLGYVQLGQSSSTLSGGEAQRIKLASFLTKGDYDKPIWFVFDEPTTGLHFEDIKKLLKAFDELLAMGHSLLVIEHNMDIIKMADWIIDLGPEGGDKGGNLVAQGTPEQVAKNPASFTGKYLLQKL
ncbi:MAG TPA: excinuclease ABC subunit UvrA [Luteibaculaceae bacterium]|nr:excinuclease ABC subunit UvrA [Luteibaculaceae bacterium]